MSGWMHEVTINHSYTNGILKIPQAIVRRLLPTTSSSTTSSSTTSSSAVTVMLAMLCVYVTFVITLPLAQRCSSRQIMSSGSVPRHPPIPIQPQNAVKQWWFARGDEGKLQCRQWRNGKEIKSKLLLRWWRLGGKRKVFISLGLKRCRMFARRKNSKQHSGAHLKKNIAVTRGSGVRQRA